MTTDLLDLEQLSGLAEAAGVDAVRMILEAFWESTDELTNALTSALAANDADACIKAGHALKGSSANLGAARLANRAKDIEMAARDGKIEEARTLFSQFAGDISLTRSAMDDVLVSFG